MKRELSTSLLQLEPVRPIGRKQTCGNQSTERVCVCVREKAPVKTGRSQKSGRRSVSVAFRRNRSHRGPLGKCDDPVAATSTTFGMQDDLPAKQPYLPFVDRLSFAPEAP